MRLLIIFENDIKLYFIDRKNRQKGKSFENDKSIRIIHNENYIQCDHRLLQQYHKHIGYKDFQSQGCYQHIVSND